jgi:hypothetical protein
VTAFVVNQHPDPLFGEILQEVCIDQGVGGYGSGPSASPVPEKQYNGALYGPGLGMGGIRKGRGFDMGIFPTRIHFHNLQSHLWIEDMNREQHRY